MKNGRKFLSNLPHPKWQLANLGWGDVATTKQPVVERHRDLK